VVGRIIRKRVMGLLGILLYIDIKLKSKQESRRW
jgi:hypothetical protein